MFLGKTLLINTLNLESSGSSVISDRNYQLMERNSSQMFKYSISLTLKNIKQNIHSILFDFNLVNDFDLKDIIQQIKSNQIDTVFVDTSLLGNVAKEIKINFPNVYVIAFFHNVEYDYFKELIKVSKRFQHYFTLILIKKAEKQLIKFSDVIITLNQRDSDGINDLYGKRADLLLPTSFVDVYNEEKYMLNRNKTNVLKLLFVGSYFPPNIYAVDWFVNNVLKNIKREVEFYVVGNGFETHKFKQIDPRIKLIGRVTDLTSYYYMSDLVVAPIFHGSGMKTKVAEALMYNKPILGTKEAFEGYEIDSNCIGFESEEAVEHIEFIEEFKLTNFKNIRKIFLDNYSFEKINSNFYKFFNERK
ncbi:hypothetical protein BB050_02175 [Flavobacterium anhuiense]|uniref:Glycosyltransferase n=1 Tax=Flavobacterium anhuiense TaxID=459526 RepID=A0AAC9D292_9FLAO|nr:glycosyltransferase [Flavobacterium anhuiense]AOC95291.1 hypothetical protein BB050_02175 [Flavobacterium anhuiense]